MFAALHLPDLPVVAALRLRPAAWRRPCGVLALDPGAVIEKVKLPLMAVNDAARVAGISAGWPLNRALVRCPDLEVLAPHPEGEADVLRRMVALAESLTPDLEIATRDTLLLDLSRATERQASRLGWLEMDEGELRHVRAATPDLARLAVRVAACHGQVVSPAVMKTLPLELLAGLPGGGERLGLLESWGLATLGDFMKLPRQSLVARLGAEAGGWHDLLHGKRCRLLRLHRPPESLSQEMDFEEPVNSCETLLFAFQRLLGSLTARLAARHVAVRALRVGFRLEDGSEMVRVLRLPEPRVEGLLKPVQVLLENLKPRAAVLGVSLDAEAVPPTAAQRDWFVKELPQPERWNETLSRLEALLGESRVGIPLPPASHRPDDFRVLPPRGGGVGEGGGCPACPVPLRRYRPPREVVVAFEAGPKPLALLTGPHRGEILETRGPFRQSGDWWDPERAWQRLEWDVRVGSGLLRLAFLPPERWLLEGAYGEH